MSLIKKVMHSFDYENFLNRHTHVLYSPGGELRVCCPKCLERKYKLYVNNDKKLFKCFRCSFSNRDSDLFDLVALFSGSDRYSTKLRLLHEYSDVAPDWEDILNDTSTEKEEPSLDIQVRTLDTLPVEAKPLLEAQSDHDAAPFYDYVVSRGITDSEISQLKVHYIPETSVPIHAKCAKLPFSESRQKGQYKGNIGRRILIPIYGPGHNLVSWIARSIPEDRQSTQGPKYLNAPNTDLSKTFWPFVPPRGSRVVLVEGVLDSLAVRRFEHSAYCTFGKSISKTQLMILESWGVKEVVLFWDKRDAINEMKRSIETLKMHFDRVFVPSFNGWPTDQDAGDTLNHPELGKAMHAMLTDSLIDVMSFEYAVWSTFDNT